MTLLDLFSGAGGAAMGYHRVGFEVAGVDHRPQKRYPFEFVCADALEYVREHGHEYDAIHASPPCQRYSKATAYRRAAGVEYPDLLAATREALSETGRPWVIENVPGAPMRADVILCGRQLGLRVIRHRWFELSWPLAVLVPPCEHDGTEVPVYGDGTPSWHRSRRDGKEFTIDEQLAAMETPWMVQSEMTQAIPPAYTEWLGRHLLAHLTDEAARHQEEAGRRYEERR